MNENKVAILIAAGTGMGAHAAKKLSSDGWWSIEAHITLLSLRISDILPNLI